jgi:hypothetical protein
MRRPCKLLSDCFGIYRRFIASPRLTITHQAYTGTLVGASQLFRRWEAKPLAKTLNKEPF